jgi:integrase
MARTLNDQNLKDRAARGRLEARGKPHYRLIEEGLHLGYRKPKGRRSKPAGAGKWILRRYDGKQAYVVETIGVADDHSDADGVAILNFKQAQAAARERMVQRAHTAAGVAGPLTVEAAIEAHFEHLEGKGKNVRNARHHARAFIYPVLGNTEVTSLTTKQLRKWLHDLAKMPARVRTEAGKPQRHRAIDNDDTEAKAEAVRRRRSSANRIRTTLIAALNHAWREKLVASDAEWRRVEPFENVDAARTRYLTVAEAKRLINASDPEFRPMAQAALETGCRYGELCRLRVADFNPNSGTLAIQQSKSGRSRHVVLTDEGAAFFRQLVAGRASDDLILRRADGRAWRKANQDRFMAAACARAKIEPIGIHGLRHTWASLAVMAGVPLMVVAKNLGHTDTSMVEKFYGHLAPSYIADAIRAGAPRFGFKPSSTVTPLQKRGG